MTTTFTAAVPVFDFKMTLEELLVLGASLRVMEDDLLEDAGVTPIVVSRVQPLFDRIDSILTDVLGDDWPLDVTTPEKLDVGKWDVGKWESMIGDAFK